MPVGSARLGAVTSSDGLAVTASNRVRDVISKYGGLLCRSIECSFAACVTENSSASWGAVNRDACGQHNAVFMIRMLG